MVSVYSATDPAQRAAGLRFLDGGGEMGAMLRGMEWQDHALGPPESWPAALKVSVSLCLRSRFPSSIHWGEDFLLLYNDAWIPFAPDHPRPLGRPGAEAHPDAWPMLAPQFADTLATAEGIGFVAQQLILPRYGVPTVGYWTYTSSPIQDEDGVARGLMNFGLEVTDHVHTERALRATKREHEFILALVEEQRLQRDPDDLMQVSAQAVGKFLHADRTGFFEVIDDTQIRYGACWIGGPLQPTTGSLPAIVFGARMIERARNGGTLVFNTPDDAEAPDRAGLDLVGAKAGINVPLVRDGNWQGSFFLSHATPRVWTRAEIGLVEEVAQLSWDAVSRVRAVERLRVLNADLAGEVAARTAERNQLWEVSNDLLGIAERDGRWLAVNPAWERLLGWLPEEIIGRDTQWLRHPEDTGGSAAEVARIAATGTTHRLEKRLRTRDGDYRILSWQTTLFDGRLYSTARDITEERRQQAAAVAADARMRSALEAMRRVGVWTYDVASNRFESDLGFAALYGFGVEDMAKGVTLADVLARIHPQDLPIVLGAIDRAQKTQDGGSQYRVILPDGTVRSMMVRNHVQCNAEGLPEKVIGVGFDVSKERDQRSVESAAAAAEPFEPERLAPHLRDILGI